ncbi:hypothetical protein PV327_003359 [Microctonus hyperodae]|uniref:Uncharacterized protein n=1 Tax=Microctonus hyperodae TaxID=165561 RepID=A0AA39G3U0_MICHY|nr:hypothetical protein PV327_003359 [Microctonus hyperodae]
MDDIFKEFRSTMEEKLKIDVTIEKLHLRALLENSIPNNNPQYNLLVKRRNDLKKKEAKLREIICDHADNEEESFYKYKDRGPTRQKYYKLKYDIHQQEAHHTLNRLREEWCEHSRRLNADKRTGRT